MRIDQIITLVWAGNVALLGGSGYVGWRFYEAKKAQSRPAAEDEWPETAEGGLPPTRWPGAIAGFEHLWKTPLSGLVPPPPEPKAGPKVEKIDMAQAFKNRVKIQSGAEASSPAFTMVTVTVDGQSQVLRPGNRIDDWKLVRFWIERAPDTASTGYAEFENPQYEKRTLVLKQDIADGKEASTPGAAPLIKEFGGPLTEGDVNEFLIETQAYFDPVSKAWVVPYDEYKWWAVWGTKDVIEETRFVPRPEGLEVATRPPSASLDGSRGVEQGDVITTINGHPVKTLDDVFAYLRGDGQNETRFVVEIQRDGAKRTIVYRVARRASPRAKPADAKPADAERADGVSSAADGEMARPK